jgi:SAM-dependent methyltransferase
MIESAARTAREISLPTRILLRFCRRPGTSDYPMQGVHYEAGKELQRLEKVFPGIGRDVAGKVVIDFGCGTGYQSVAFAKLGAKQVIAVEIEKPLLEMARQRATELGLSGQIRFVTEIPEGEKADMIVSQNSFEHFLDASRILARMRAALSPAGKIFVTFAPPWYAPWGAHMGFFCKLPWVQLFFAEHIVMEARSFFRSDGSRTYREAGLAQMSLRKFEAIVKQCGLRSTFQCYDCSRGLTWLQYTPLREFFVNCVSCTLSPPTK